MLFPIASVSTIENDDSSRIPDVPKNGAVSEISLNANISIEPKDISRRGEEKKEQNLQNYTFKKQADGRSFQFSWLAKFS